MVTMPLAELNVPQNHVYLFKPQFQKNDVDIVLRRGLWYYTHHLLGIDVVGATIEKQASGLALRQE